MIELLLAFAFPFTQIGDDLGNEKPPTKAAPLDKFPRALMTIAVSNASDGAKGWVKLEDVLVDVDGTGYVKRSARMFPSETPDHKVCVRVTRGGLALDLFAYYVWDAAPVGATEGLIEVKEIHLKFREPR